MKIKTIQKLKMMGKVQVQIKLVLRILSEESTLNLNLLKLNKKKQSLIFLLLSLKLIHKRLIKQSLLSKTVNSTKPLTKKRVKSYLTMIFRI